MRSIPNVTARWSKSKVDYVVSMCCCIVVLKCYHDSGGVAAMVAATS